MFDNTWHSKREKGEMRWDAVKMLGRNWKPQTVIDRIHQKYGYVPSERQLGIWEKLAGRKVTVSRTVEKGARLSPKSLGMKFDNIPVRDLIAYKAIPYNPSAIKSSLLSMEEAVGGKGALKKFNFLSPKIQRIKVANIKGSVHKVGTYGREFELKSNIGVKAWIKERQRFESTGSFGKKKIKVVKFGDDYFALDSKDLNKISVAKYEGKKTMPFEVIEAKPKMRKTSKLKKGRIGVKASEMVRGEEVMSYGY